MARELKEINQEYGNVCAQLGEKVYQLGIIQSQINSLQVKCAELQKEGIEAVEASKKSEELKNAVDAAQ